MGVLFICVGIAALLLSSCAQQGEAITVTITPTARTTTDRCQQHFETGMVYPQWSPQGYGPTDQPWQTGVQQIRTQAAACWLEMPLLFEQPSSTQSVIQPGDGTPTLASFSAGIRYAHVQGFHVFVTPLVNVGGAQPWIGSLQFTTGGQEQAWFNAYWQAIKPYAIAAQQLGVEQLAIGTEEAWLENHAPSRLWDMLIRQVRSVFSGTLTYDRNWGSLSESTPAWMHNADLAMIGVSSYFPLETTPARVDPNKITALWASIAMPQIDSFARTVDKPLFISETGYRATADALYHAWEVTSTAPKDQEEQAAAINGELVNVCADTHIHGIFFWGWSNVEEMSLAGTPAIQTIHRYYAPMQ